MNISSSITLESEPAPAYNLSADVLRIVATLGVVLIHTVYSVYSRPDFLGGTAWWLANILNTLSRSSIPVFIMVSGYLVLPKNESVVQTWQRIWHRLLIPLIFWFGWYLWWDASFLSKSHTWIQAVSQLLLSNAYHLYFLIILAGLYALSPVLRLVLIHQPKLVWLLVKLSFAIGIIYYAGQYLLLPSESLFNSVTIWLPFLGYFLLGHLLRHLPAGGWRSAKHKWWLLGLSLVITASLGYLNVWLRQRGVALFWRNGISYFDEYLSPNVILMSLTWFHLVMSQQAKLEALLRSSWLIWSIKQLARSCFAVYLIHFTVINYIDMGYRFAIEFLDSDLLIYFVTRTSLIVVASFAAGMILVRLPLIKPIFGEK